MEEKKSIIGGICRVPIEQPQKMTGLDNIDKTSDLIPSISFDVSKHFSIGEGDPFEKYRQTYGDNKNIKWGQFKLLLGEIDFLCRYWDSVAIPNPQVVYIGAAPGTHIGVLSDLFPMITFHLYDSGQKYDFKVLGTKTNVKLNKDFEPDKWVDQKDVFLWSDIRNLKYIRADVKAEREQRENERVVWEDMQLQMSWIEKIKPVKSFIKFRLPYSYHFNTEKGSTRPYLDGIVYRQVWAPKTSTECRLVPYDDLRKRDWDYKHHEEQMFYHNTQVRPRIKFYNPITKTNEQFPIETGLDDKYDSTLTIIIAMGYLQKFGITSNQDNILKLFKILDLGAAGGRTTLYKTRNQEAQEVDDDDDERFLY